MTASLNPPLSTFARLTRAVDVRREELPAAAQAFVVLLLILTAHTVLETARDAIILIHLPPRELGITYVAVALVVLPASALASKVAARFGARRALVGAMVLACAALVTLFNLHTTRNTALGLYVASGLIGAVVVPQFWGLLGSFFTVAQARRLLGPIAAAAVIGATIGSSSAAALLIVLRVKGLLLVAAGILLLAVAVLAFGRRVESRLVPAGEPGMPMLASSGAIKSEPFLGRIALLVVASTAAALAVDYFFKWTVARNVEPTLMVPFVARYYAILNGISLLAQVFLSGALVKRMGVATAIIVTPLLFVLFAVFALGFDGALGAVLVLRAVSGALVNSVNRVTMELVYLPVPNATRARAKPFIDGALGRATQAAAGGFFLALGVMVSPWLLALCALVLAMAWLAVAVTTRRPYLDLLRRSIGRGGPAPGTDPIDLESAAQLVQLLGHDDPSFVLGAVNALARRGRDDLIPALLLLHEDEGVVVRALSIFSDSKREDWIPRATRLLSDPRTAVRKATMRALARRRQLDPSHSPLEVTPWMQGYVSVRAALQHRDVPIAVALEALISRPGPSGDELRLGMLSAIVDQPRGPRFEPLLLALAEHALPTGEWTEGLARASAAHRTVVVLPDLISRLSLRDGREALRDALVSLGAPALQRVHAALGDTSRSRSLRVHLPNTIAHFETRDAAMMLLDNLESEPDGLVRYKSLRSLERLVVDKRLAMPRARIEKLLRRNLEEYVRLLALRDAFEDETLEAAAARLLVRLLDDKLAQALERVFRLLHVENPAENIRSVRMAVESNDKRARANALELLDTLMDRRDQRSLSALLRTVTDDLSVGERLDRAAEHMTVARPSTLAEALAVLAADPDAMVSALAQLHASSLAGRAGRVTLRRRESKMPEVELETSAPLLVVDG